MSSSIYRGLCFVLLCVVKFHVYIQSIIFPSPNSKNNVYVHLGITDWKSTLDGPLKSPGMISAVSALEETAPFDRYMDRAPASLHQVQNQGSA